jgi:hypothetical protein
VETEAADQLRINVRSDEVRQLASEKGLEIRAHLIIIVGSRHILLWDMDKDGKLHDNPQLVEGPGVHPA